MSRPKVAIENYKEVYEFYRSHEQGARSAPFLHWVLSMALTPEVQYAPGAKEQITDTLAQGRTLALASNHTNAVDPLVIASLMKREEVFAPLIGNAFIPSKKPIQALPIVRHLADGLGAIPVFRDKDIRHENDAKTPLRLARDIGNILTGTAINQASKDQRFIEKKKLLGVAGRGLIKTSIGLLNEGQHMGLFPEGERNKIDPLKIQEPQRGIGLMVCRVSDVEQPAIVPMAIHFGDSVREPAIFVGNPSTEAFAKGGDVLEWLPEQMQNSLDCAVDMYELRAA